MEFLNSVLGLEEEKEDRDEGPGRADFFANMSAEDKARYEEAAIGLSKEQLLRLQNIFDRHDADKSGEIDVHELQAAMAELGTKLSLPEAQRLISLMDESGDGLIQFWEFVEFFKPGIQNKHGKNVTDMVAGTLKQNASQLRDQLGDINKLRDYQDRAQAAMEEVQKIEAEIDKLKTAEAGQRDRPAFKRRLGELTRALFISNDKAGLKTLAAERLKRKLELAKNPSSINPSRARLYRTVDRDLGLGLQMVNEVHSSIMVCASRMDDLRAMRHKEKRMIAASVSVADLLAIEDLHKEMADLLCEIKNRAEDIEAQCDELDAGAIKVRKYWYNQLSTDLLLAKFEKEFDFRGNAPEDGAPQQKV